MNQRKPNRKTWYSLELMVLLCIALLVTATGTSLARYRAEREEEIGFKVRLPEQIHLGMVSTVQEESGENGQAGAEQEFVPSSQLAWETEDGVSKLTFAVANGTSALDYSARDQSIRLRMIGSLGIWTGTQAPVLHLILPSEEGSDQERVIPATVRPFEKGASLHLAYGEGFLYTFLDEEGEELSWELPGGKLSYITLTVVIDGEVPENKNLLQPQVIAEVIQD